MRFAFLAAPEIRVYSVHAVAVLCRRRVASALTTRLTSRLTSRLTTRHRTTRPSCCFCCFLCVPFQVEPDAVLSLVADPQNSGTKADYSKFHDDRSTWTGVALEGGPSTIDAKPTLASQANRDNAADVRGVVQ